MIGLLKKILGNKAEKDIKILMPYLEKIKKEYKQLASISNDELRQKTIVLQEEICASYKEEKAQIEKNKKLLDEKLDMPIDEKEALYKETDDLEKKIKDRIEDALEEALPRAFAIVKETARRFKENKTITVTASDNDKQLATTKDFVEINGDKAIYKNNWKAGGNDIVWDMVHYDVQLIGGVALHQGKIAEMATGEGKTLVATLPVFLNALSGRGVHLVTVNDYLARRDAEWMGPIYQFHGLSVDCIDNHEPHSPERKKAYDSSITFGTNNEFGFDYLRDNMSRNKDELVQRPHNYAIVDEVDSVLIDDARTPLIISGPTPKGDEHEFFQLKPRIEKLVSIQRKLATKLLAEAKQLLKNDDKESQAKGGKLLFTVYRGLPKNKALIKFMSEIGIKAILQKTENIYLAENSKRMPEIDKDLYFTIDEKNNSIDLTEKGIDLITNEGDDNDFFIMPNIGEKIAEIENQYQDEKLVLQKKDELMRDFAIKSERIHTINQLLKAYTLFEKDVEYVVIDSKVKIVDEQTGRIMDGRRYSDGLHQAIEAKENVKVEAATQTYATVTLQNYFRMYNKLAGMTGTAETEAGELWDIYKLDVVVIPTNLPIIRDDREDLIYKTKREKYLSIVDEIVALRNANRPVLVGTTSVEVSELLSRMLKMKGIKHNVLNAKLHQKEADIVAEAGIAKTVTIATNMAGRGTDIKLKEGVKEAGGLAIIGTERHESRRVDRQLRGRAGRQGDPGSSQFFVSLEDDLMRLFGSDRIAKMMDRLGIKEGEVIQHSMISKSIERAQKKVEENHFGTRKRLLEYDDVMNSQREVIYTKRRNALYGERLSLDINNMMFDVCENIIQDYVEQRDYEGLKIELLRILSMNPPFSEEDFFKQKPEDLIEKLFDTVKLNYKRKTDTLAQQSYPVFKDIYESQSHKYDNVVVPLTDGKKTIQVMCELKKAYETGGTALNNAFEKEIMLALIDEAWKEHLRELDDLKQAAHNASYEQKDPLLIYKFESFELFKTMLMNLNKEVTGFMMKGHLPMQEEPVFHEVRAPQKTDMSQLETSRREMEMAAKQAGQEQIRNEPVKVEPKVGRNEPCPCGSGKKYKHCHGKKS